MITMPVWLLLLLFFASGATGAAIMGLGHAAHTLNRILTEERARSDQPD